jgi:PilZ domain
MRWPHPRVDRVSPPPYVGTERRRTPRYYVQLPVQSASATGTTIDVNEDGVRFESNHRFAYGEVVTLRLVFRHIAGDYTYIDVTGDVVRVEEIGETFVVAVRVEEIHVN